MSFSEWMDKPAVVHLCHGRCAQSGLTLCDPMDCSPPGSSAHGIFQARVLERVAISYSRGSFWPRNQTHVFWVSCIGRWIVYHCTIWEAPYHVMLFCNKEEIINSISIKLDNSHRILLTERSQYQKVMKGRKKMDTLLGSVTGPGNQTDEREQEKSHADFMDVDAFMCMTASWKKSENQKM